MAVRCRAGKFSKVIGLVYLLCTRSGDFVYFPCIGLKVTDRKSVFRGLLRNSAGRARVARSLHPRVLGSTLPPCERRWRDESMTTDARTYVCVCVCVCVPVCVWRERENDEMER